MDKNVRNCVGAIVISILFLIMFPPLFSAMRSSLPEQAALFAAVEKNAIMGAYIILFGAIVGLCVLLVCKSSK